MRAPLRPYPEQAVILAGGRGTRLMPLTADRPKPMIPFHGRPFLAYLIDMLRDQGVRRVLLLLGYRADVITDYFGDGTRFGIEIKYHISSEKNDTGRRLVLARDLIDPIFFLLYCDNYWPLPYASLWEAFKARDCLAQVVVYHNKDRYTRDNLRLGQDGLIDIYDKTRQTPGLQGVDIGFILLRREVLDRMPADGNPSFEAVVYPALIAERQLAAYRTDHRYYSVGSLARLPLTEAFLARRPTVFLDRDGTLNRRMPPGAYVRSWADWTWLPGARDALVRLNQAGWRVIVVTNQAGIARGMVTPEALDAVHARMRAEARAVGGEIEAIQVCPHGWDDGCSCRKPAPGMLFTAQAQYHLDLSRTPLIGDDERDGQAAAAAGCPYRVLRDDDTLAAAVEDLLAGRWSSFQQP